MRMPGYPTGVPSQYTVHYHPWPTRFHGPLYQRPVFQFPWMASPQNVFKPGDFYPEGTAGLGETSGVSSALLIAALLAGVSYAAYRFGFQSGVEYSFGARR